ncbi:MAG: hypothetical protein QW331_03675 [Candidatus Woesearchaeota archaeon]
MRKRITIPTLAVILTTACTSLPNITKVNGQRTICGRIASNEYSAQDLRYEILLEQNGRRVLGIAENISPQLAAEFDSAVKTEEEACMFPYGKNVISSYSAEARESNATSVYKIFSVEPKSEIKRRLTEEQF